LEGDDDEEDAMTPAAAALPTFISVSPSESSTKIEPPKTKIPSDDKEEIHSIEKNATKRSRIPKILARKGFKDSSSSSIIIIII
jgi:hypothetical protein